MHYTHPLLLHRPPLTPPFQLSNILQRLALLDAAKLAGLNVMGLIHNHAGVRIAICLGWVVCVLHVLVPGLIK